jgi:dihydropteroate synthase
MGILNVTPDSFYDGGAFDQEKTAVDQVGKMLSEGASIIDIGAQSTRPASQHLDAETEWKRLEVILGNLRKEFPNALFSIDTFHSSVAERAVGEGCSIVNDISGGTMDPLMFPTMVRLNVPYILMHIQGTPQTMQQQPHYENVVAEVHQFLQTKIQELKNLGLKDVIIDPGFGFGKTLEQNYQLLNGLSSLNSLDVPMLVGISRKSMINKVLSCSASESLNGTTVLNTLALLGGASILRVHDVKQAVEAVKLVGAFKSVGEN